MKWRERRSGSSERARMAFGGAEGDRTPDLRIANAALCQTELLPHGHENTVSSFRFQVSGFKIARSARMWCSVRAQDLCAQVRESTISQITPIIFQSNFARRLVSLRRERERLRVCTSEGCPAIDKHDRSNSGAFVRRTSRKASNFVGPDSFRG